MIRGKFVLLSLLFWSVSTGYSQTFNLAENSVYIFNFIKYTNWAHKTNNIQVGVIGNTQLEAELRKLLSRKSNSSVTYTIKNITSAEAKSVDVIIVAKNASAQVKEVSKLTEGLPVLIITEKENMGRMGACISFYIDEDNEYKTGYQLSLRNCKARGITVNEQILNNAILIR